VRPGDHASVRVEGTDVGSMIRGKIIRLETERDGEWKLAGSVHVSRTPDAASLWMPVDAQRRYVVTAEGYRGSSPMYFTVPPLAPGDYRLRFDMIHYNGDLGDVRHRTASLEAPLRILPPPE